MSLRSGKLPFLGREDEFLDYTGWVSTALSDCVTRCVGRVSQGLSLGLNSSGQCGGWLRSNRVWSERKPAPHGLDLVVRSAVWIQQLTLPTVSTRYCARNASSVESSAASSVCACFQLSPARWTEAAWSALRAVGIQVPEIVAIFLGKESCQKSSRRLGAPHCRFIQPVVEHVSSGLWSRAGQEQLHNLCIVRLNY